MLSRALPKDEHFALALHILKEAHPELVPEKVNTDIFIQRLCNFIFVFVFKIHFLRQEWESFITNFALVDETGDHKIPNWIKKNVRSKVISLKMNHPDLYNRLQLENENLWRSFTESTSPNDLPVHVTELQKILITQIFRPDLLIITMTRSLSKLLMTNVPSEMKPSIQQLFEETHEDEPILFITNGEIDPSKDVSDFCQHKLGHNKFMEMAIGKGQEKGVMQQIRAAAQSGNWICVKNVQLVPSWLNELNETLQTLAFHDGFRIWLVCDGVRHFPSSLLNKCNKVLYEAPNSIKAKVQRLIHQWRSLLEKKRDAKLLKIYISLFIFNAVVQERKSFVPQGWTKPYEFSDADLKAAIDIIGAMEKITSFKMDWSILKELCRLIAYGGRIDNAQDQVILKAHFDEFFTEKMLSNSWSPLELKCTIPLSYNVQDYLNALFRLPDTDNPEALGLSSVTILIRDTIMCRNILKQLRRKSY